MNIHFMIAEYLDFVHHPSLNGTQCLGNWSSFHCQEKKVGQYHLQWILLGYLIFVTANIIITALCFFNAHTPSFTYILTLNLAFNCL
jgi:hypothetical protein